MKTIALIPAYQPSMGLAELVGALRRAGAEVVVVDDGSGARYQHVFDAVRYESTVIGYGENRGKGHALKEGLAYVERQYGPDDVVVTVDADGQHDPADVMRCAREAQALGDALVLGCRSFDGADVPLRSRLGNVITRGVYRLASGTKVSDTQTGLRAFPVWLVPFLRQVEGERYEYEMNVLMACPREGIALREVPIRTIYEDGNACSHFRPLADSVRIYGGILAFVASSLMSFVLDYLLFWLLAGVLAGLGAPGVALANVAARLVSATVNFLVNRRLVFHSSESLYVTAVRYALLALSILAGNTCAMVLLTGTGVPAHLAKLAVELVFFVISWTMQSQVVFPRGRASLPMAAREAQAEA